MLELIRLTKIYGDRRVLSELSFRFEEARTYILQGSSGSGKTTLLHLIAGTVPADSGSISTARVSMSFQDANLLPGLNVLQNVMIGRKIPREARGEERKKRKQDRRDTAVFLLRRLGITDLSQRPEELSGGMKARVGIARALLKDADVYLFDEPFAGLDLENIRAAAALIRECTRGKTVIAVVHDSQNVPDFADEKLELRSGETSTLVPV